MVKVTSVVQSAESLVGSLGAKTTKSEKREGSVQYVDSDAGECESALGFTARAMRTSEAHRDGVNVLHAINVRLKVQLG